MYPVQARDRAPVAGFAQRFGGMGLGFDHLKPTL